MAHVKFLDLLPAEQVFVYNIINMRDKGVKFDDFVRLDENSALTSIKTRNNHVALVEGYTLPSDMYGRARLYYDQMNVPAADLGITFILANFASYMSYNQYFLLAHDFNCLDELDMFERALLECSDSYVKLPFDLAIDREYGLRSVAPRMGDKLYTRDKFAEFLRFLRNADITIERFVDVYVAGYEPRIVEGLYAMTSFKRSNSTIYDCRRLNSRLFQYNMDPIVVVDEKDYTYDGVYWFHLSAANRIAWFATTCGRVWYKGYITRRNEQLVVDTFKSVGNYVIVGVLVNDYTVYPIRIDGLDFNGKWHLMRDFFRQHGLNDVFNTGVRPSFAKSYFVVDGKTQIFKYK